jgi:precorrin-6A/cobalt-precorrin-6A reductase
MQNRIWLIGGTSESADLAWAIARAHLPCTVTVATDAARTLYHDLLTSRSPDQFRLRVGRLSQDQMPAWVQEQHIAGILDASHPFAVAVSQMAIATAQAHHLPYLRFERSTHQTHQTHQTHHFPTLSALLDSDLLTHQRVLLTIGYRFLQGFQPWQEKATLFARILPSQTALAAALAAGFTPDRLIALRPPISAELERALWQQWQISLVVTKASGSPGGQGVKHQVAAELGVPLAVIDRPAIAYPQQTSDLGVAVEFCRSAIGK